MFRNWKIWQKLALVVVLGAVPLVTLMVLFINKSDEQIARTRDELSGLDYVVPLRSLLEKLPQHRSAASAFLNGDSTMKATLVNTQSQVETAVEAVDAVESQVGTKLNTTASWSSIRARWSDLKKRVQTMTPDESNKFHTQMIADIMAHLRLVGDHTGLTTDPGLDSYYLAQTILGQLGWTAEYVGQLASYGAGAAAKSKLGAADEAQLRFLVRQVVTSGEFLERDMQAAYRYNDRLRKALSEPVSTMLNATGFVRATTQKEILDAEKIAIHPKTILEAGSVATDKVFAVYDETVAQMKTLFLIRMDKLAKEKWLQLGLAIFLLILGLTVTFGLNSSITQQVRSIKETFEQVAKGQLDARAEVYSRDELGSMAHSTNEMLANTLTLIQSREERDKIQSSILRLLDEVSGVAEGDLSKDADVTAEVTGAIADSFNYMIAELRSVIGAVQATTGDVTRTAQQVQTSTENLASNSQEQSSRILQASSTIQGLTRSIQQVSTSANTAAAVAQQALSSALAGGESVRKTQEGMNGIRTQVQETAKRMKRLGESSQEIGEIVQLISDIADRTSILALNASIQAAMAGEAGKGFAVVAEEVERLAERATESTKRITTLIKSVQSDTTEAIAAMEETTREVVGGSLVAAEAGERLAQIESVSKRISEVVEGISNTAQKEAASSEKVAQTVTAISDATELTAAGTRQVAVEIRRLAGLVTELNSSLGRFKLPEQQPETASIDATAETTVAA